MPISQQKDYLAWSIFSLLCCFCPLGLAALIFSLKSRDAANQNDSDTATKYSRKAFSLNIAALVAGIIMIIIVIVYSIVVRSR
ncbi:dispanin subfamily A member 2b-like [Dendropsophus ebraccatus]|uniref:dispanin subfamily A member 2b-like n=1 Tax=Dendropsophus ebraccatus TaxID=150705 RepID=UPI003831284E